METEQTPNRQDKKLSLQRRQCSRHSYWESNPATFWPQAWCTTNWASHTEVHVSQVLSSSVCHAIKSPQAHLLVVGMLWFMSDIIQPSLPTPFYSVESVSVFMAFQLYFIPQILSTTLCFLALFCLSYWSFQLYISLLKSPSALIWSFVVDWA